MIGSYLTEEEGGQPSAQRGQHVQRSCSGQGGSVLLVGRGRESWGVEGGDVAGDIGRVRSCASC